MNNLNEETVLTPEELELRKKEMLDFYTDSLPYLEAQFKYEELLMKVDEVRFRRTNIQMQYANLMDSQEPEKENVAASTNKESFKD
jgi:hypothetical protein